MDLGLYNLKHGVRRLIRGVLPVFANVEPNAISWSLLPVGAATAAVYWLGAQGRPWLYLAGAALIFLRMFLGTLDGLVAVHYGKGTPRGEIVNRLAPELCDVMLVTALALARPEWLLPGVGALAMAWLTTFSGLVGATAGAPTQSVGPVGQTDRLAALQLSSFAAFAAETFGYGVDFLWVFLWWTIAGGILTVVLRLHRTLRATGTVAAAQPSDPAAPSSDPAPPAPDPAAR
jgi:CDP-diacylglycerol--glycerol-3-phosphate 3-phosphatidyltransferase